MTGKQRALEILKDFDTWCLCGKKECAKSENFIQALDSIEEVVKEVLGEQQAIAESPTRPIPDYEALHQNKLLLKELGRWEDK